MSIPDYRDLIDLLGSSYESDQFRSTAEMLRAKSLSKDDGFKARVSCPEAGLTFYFEKTSSEWACESIMIYPGGVEEHSRYLHIIEGGVTLPASRRNVHSLLGHPSECGGGGPMLLGVLVDYHWDRYDKETYSVRFEYDNEQGNIRLTTLMSRSLVVRLTP